MNLGCSYYDLEWRLMIFCRADLEYVVLDAHSKRSCIFDDGIFDVIVLVLR